MCTPLAFPPHWAKKPGQKQADPMKVECCDLDRILLFSFDFFFLETDFVCVYVCIAQVVLELAL